MNKVNGYSVYQNNYYDSSVHSRKEQNKTSGAASSKKTQRFDRSGGTAQLSDKAKALLQELKKNYTNMDFIVADYDSDEEAESYLARGTKEYSVLIDPEELERMASDDSVKEQNLSLLDNAVSQLDGIKEQLGEHKDEVVRMGVTIGKDGDISFFAELEKSGERQKEFIDYMRENKKEAAEKAEADRNADPRRRYESGQERTRRTTVYASSAEELLDRIANTDWDSIREEASVHENGKRFSTSI